MKHLLFIVFTGLSLSANAQIANPDSMFKVAQELAYAKEYDSCIDLCNQVLVQYPDYVDFSILKARCYTWRGDIDFGIQILENVLKTNPDNYEAYSALTDFYHRKGAHVKQLTMCKAALVQFPKNQEFLMKTTNAYIALEQDTMALNTLDTLLKYFPKNKVAKQLKYRLKTKHYGFYIWGNTTQESFSDLYGDRSLSFLEIGQKLGRTTTIVRLNYADRFGLNGWQTEGDIYYSIDDKSYAYVNIGVSNAISLFPKSRLGAEYYRYLHRNIRASIGIRHLTFQPDDSTKRTTTIYTGTVTGFYNNYSFTFQPFITPVSSGTVNTFIFKLQRIFDVEDHYLRLEAGSGFSPDSWRNPSLTLNQRINDDAFLLQSRRAALYYQFPIKFKLLANCQVMYEQQEIITKQGSFIDVLGLTAGVKYRF